MEHYASSGREDGWGTALTAEGLPMEDKVNLFIRTRDHPPPHVHIKRRGEKDIKIDLDTAALRAVFHGV